MQMKKVLCFVMPCYNEEAIIMSSVQIVSEKLDMLVDVGLVHADSFMLFADDGSSDETWQMLKQAYDKNPRKIKCVRLAANRGKECALWAGLMEARKDADIMIVMDADLQFDIDAADNFIKLHEEGYDLIYGIKKNRGKEAFYKTVASRAFYKLMSVLGAPVEKNHSDYCLLTREVSHALSEYGEVNLIFRGLLKQLGFKQTFCYFDVIDRQGGESHFSFRRLVGLSLNAITSFSVAPLRFIGVLGVCTFTISLFMICWTMYGYITQNPPSGYATLACSIWLLGGVGLLCMSVIGEYLGKLYVEAKKRPRYYIAERLD